MIAARSRARRDAAALGSSSRAGFERWPSVTAGLDTPALQHNRSRLANEWPAPRPSGGAALHASRVSRRRLASAADDSRHRRRCRRDVEARPFALIHLTIGGLEERIQLRWMHRVE